MPLILVGMMITSYLGTMQAPEPNHMPIVVAGAQAGDVASALADAEGDAVDVSTADSALEAREAVIAREVSAAIVVGDGSATIYTSSAAGASQARTVVSLVAPFLGEEGLAPTNEDVAPLPDGDLTGMGAMLMTTALVMAGYLPFSVLASNSPELLRFRRIVPLMAGWAALIAGIVWAVAGPILGVVSLDRTPAVLVIDWLEVFAISSVQLFITRLLGPLGVIVGMLFLMVLGMPSSNMAMSVYTMPTFFQWTHGFLPMPAIGESMRSVLYFGGEGVTPHLLVLALGAAAGLLATKAYDAISRRRHPEGRELAPSIPTLWGGRRPASRVGRYISVLAFPLAMVTMMISSMLGSMHAATPHDMPVAVVGQTSDQAQQAADGLDEQMDGMYDFAVYAAADEDDVRTLVEDRDLVAAIVLPTQDSPQFTLIANQAASGTAFQVVDGTFAQVAAAQEMPLVVDDVAPLPDSDPNGVVVMYLAMGWILAGFMVVVVAANAQPRRRPLKRMLPLLAAYAPFMSAVVGVIAGPITGAVDGHFAALWGAGTVTIACVTMFAMVFERLIGVLAVLPTVGTLMFLGVPSSNAAMSEWMVLGIWGAVSLAIVIGIDAVRPPRTAHDFGETEPVMSA
ncbi:ABC transporter permease [Microbacterium indicum]|uniref:ABC transporter permease n=1 Tax=Microbacterium indicum TaxID=358100 RepID=UPI000683F31E